MKHVWVEAHEVALRGMHFSTLSINSADTGHSYIAAPEKPILPSLKIEGKLCLLSLNEGLHATRAQSISIFQLVPCAM